MSLSMIIVDNGEGNEDEILVGKNLELGAFGATLKAPLAVIQDKESGNGTLNPLFDPSQCDRYGFDATGITVPSHRVKIVMSVPDSLLDAYRAAVKNFYEKKDAE